MKLGLSKEYGGRALPFMDHLGVERVPDDGGRALIALNIRPEHRNGWKAAHGGILMSLMDSVMSLAVRLHTHNTPASIITIDMSVKFISPAMGERIIAEGWVIGGGRSTLFCEAAIRDTDDKLVAKCMGTLKPIRKKET